MDIALNSLFLFIIFIFPGIVFRRFYYVGKFSKQFNSGNWVNTLYISVIPGIIIQIIAYYTFTNLVYKRPAHENYKLINSFYEELKINQVPSEFFDLNLILWIFLYLIIVMIIAFVVAQICFISVRRFNFDKIFPIIRFNNYWHYYFSGESLKFKAFKGISNGDKIILTRADVLIDSGSDGTKLYRGFIKEHTICNNTGDLKTVYLTESKVKINGENKSTFKELPGDIMIIPYKNIININLTYIKDKSKKENKTGKNILFTLNLIFLLFVMANPFTIIQNTTIFGDIVWRIWAFTGWLFLTTFILTFTDKKGERENMLSTRIHLVITIIIICTILYYFFYL